VQQQKQTETAQVSLDELTKSPMWEIKYELQNLD
jgi:hypothetical protein